MLLVQFMNKLQNSLRAVKRCKYEKLGLNMKIITFVSRLRLDFSSELKKQIVFNLLLLVLGSQSPATRFDWLWIKLLGCRRKRAGWVCLVGFSFDESYKQCRED